MSLYETVFMFSGNLTEKRANEKINEIEKKVKVLKKEYWGLRSLAYKIKKNSKAHYFLLFIESENENLLEIENKLKIDEDYIRFLKLNIDKVPEEDSLILKKASEER